MKDNLIRKIFLAVYVAISIATFYHSAWGFALLAGNPPTDWLQLAGWWFIGGAQAAAIDIGMGAIVYAMLHGWERGWLVKSLFLLAGFSAYSQLVYSTAHAVAYPLGAVPEWLQWLAVALDARTVLFPLALPGFALIYAFAAKGEFSDGAVAQAEPQPTTEPIEVIASEPPKLSLPKPTIARKPARVRVTKASDKTLDRARQILANDPQISGGELGRKLGKSESRGRQLRAEILPTIEGPANGNGAHQ